MHRTTSAATLLVTVAVSALSGCTTVQSPAASDPPAAPARSAQARPSGHSAPEAVQAPAREALALIEESRRPGPKASPSRPPAPARSAPSAARESAAPARPGHAGPRRPASGGEVPQRPRASAPDVARSLPPAAGGGGDVCALGRQYGGWRAGSPESRICEQTYGR